jgi:hypothetical protein
MGAVDESDGFDLLLQQMDFISAEGIAVLPLSPNSLALQVFEVEFRVMAEELQFV